MTNDDRWVARSEDDGRIIATGETFEAAVKNAEQAGVLDPVLMKVPDEWTMVARRRDQGLRLVLIEWVDAFGCSPSWTSLEDSRAAPLRCRSVGWLLQDTETCKVVVPHITNTTDPDVRPQGCGDMTIPTCAVTRIVDLPDTP